MRRRPWTALCHDVATHPQKRASVKCKVNLLLSRGNHPPSSRARNKMHEHGSLEVPGARRPQGGGGARVGSRGRPDATHLCSSRGARSPAAGPCTWHAGTHNGTGRSFRQTHREASGGPPRSPGRSLCPCLDRLSETYGGEKKKKKPDRFTDTFCKAAVTGGPPRPLSVGVGTTGSSRRPASERPEPPPAAPSW